MWEKIESRVAQISQFSIWVPLRILFFFFGRLKVKGWENLEKIPNTSFIIASNHLSFLDHFLISHLFPFSTRFFPFRYPAFPQHYYTWKQLFMWMLGAYPVVKGDDLEKTLAKSLQIIKNGGRILIYPEGKMREKGRRRNPRRGAAYIAAKTNAPILPCYIEGFDPLRCDIGFSWKDLFLRRYHLRVNFGKPFFIQEVYGRIPETMQEYREAAEKVMEQVYALKG